MDMLAGLELTEGEEVGSSIPEEQAAEPSRSSTTAAGARALCRGIRVAMQ